MKEKKPQKQLLLFVMLALLSVVSVLVTAGESFAALNCTNCHGNNLGTDARPLDTPAGSPASYRNITTGAVLGNHSEHMAATVNPAMCNRCHNNAGYTSSHRNGTITLLNGMNFSTRGTYTSPNLTNAGAYVFKNQTSVPTLGTCSSVNCHFESVTPTWGSNPATSITCNSCHSSSPSTGAHSKHLAGGHAPFTCDTCHGAKPNFQHATSAGNAGRGIDVSQQVLVSGSAATASYNGSNFKYLPSDTGRQFGQCSNLYCHSSGQGNGGSATVTYPGGPVSWTGTAGCGTCHLTITLQTGSHSKHYTADNNCGNCHTGATSNSMNSVTHVDQFINVDGTVAVNYSQGTSSARGNGYGRCSNAACHEVTNGAPALVTPTWGQVATCASCHNASPVTGAHTLHIAMSGVVCGTCHTGATGISGGTGHFNNLIDVTQYAGPVAKHAANVYTATCTTVCHSTDTTAVSTPSWGQQSTCSSCHAVSPTTGAHTTHLSAVIAANCGTCHNGAVQGSNAGTNHGNTLIDVVQYSAAVAKHAPGTYAATCSTACHNATGTTAVTTTTWGVISTCATCHAASPVTGDHTKHLTLTTATCGSCHTGATAGVTGGNGHGDGNIDVAQGYPANKIKGSAYSTCTTTCHNAYSDVTGLLTPQWGTAATCASCHAASPVTGDHTKHLSAPVNAVCGTCHTGATAGVTGGNGHGDGNIDVAQGYPANKAKNTAFGTCTTTCHNAYSNVTGIATPQWGTAGNCASCHAATPATGSHTQHVNYARFAVLCSNCHTGATAGTTGGAAHGDGNVDVGGVGYPTNVAKHASGSGYSTCTTNCHSTDSVTAVATPVWGSTTNCASCHASSPATGAHNAHLLTTTFNSTITCGACHTGVTAGTSGGPEHFDGNIDVATGMGYPTNIGKHAVGTYTGSCSTTWCHGTAVSPFGTPVLPADAVTPKVTPTWGATINNCTACHGNPPNDAVNHAGVVANTCNQCHPNVNSNNTFSVPQQHVDGIVQGGKCNSCHGYPPVPESQIASLGHKNNYSSARVQNYSGGGGVHAVAGHLLPTITAGQQFTPCLTCHPQGATHNEAKATFGGFSTKFVQVVVDTQFKFDKNRPIVYNGVRTGASRSAGTCTNVACHFQKSPVWSTDTYTKTH